MSKLLIQEPPLQVLPSLAARIGLEEAIVLQQIHYWVTTQQECHNSFVFRDDRWWVYNTVEEWRDKQFIWWSAPTVKRILQNLESMGVIESRQFEAEEFEQRKWYTTCPQHIELLTNLDENGWKLAKSERIKLIQSEIQERIKLIPSMGSDCALRSDQIDPFDQIRLIPSSGSNRSVHLYTERSTENSSKTSFIESDNISFFGEFSEPWEPLNIQAGELPLIQVKPPAPPINPAVKPEKKASSAAAAPGWKIAKTVSVQGENRPIKAADLSQCDRKSDFLKLYNSEKPATWPEKAGLTMHEVILVEEVEAELVFSQRLDSDAARLEAHRRLSLSLAFIKLKPAYYCQPNSRGQELAFKGFTWLFTAHSKQGRPINYLAEQATALNLNPIAISTATNPEFGTIPEGLLGKDWFQDMIATYNSPQTSAQRKTKLCELISFNIRDYQEKQNA